MDMHQDSSTKKKVQDALAGKGGKQYWRSLEELAGTEEFQAWVDDEFPNRSSLKDIDRRSFLKIMGASIALASLAGCRGVFLDQQKIVPYVKAPEELVPGKPLFYATMMACGAYASALLVEGHEGRPTKVEGNPEHPASMGGSDIFAQATILDLYDPDRLQYPMQGDDMTTWDTFYAQIRKTLSNTSAKVAFLSAPSSSPTLLRQMQAFKAKFANAEWYAYEPVNRDNVLEGSNLAFGKPVEAIYNFAAAKVVLSIGADFITGMPGSVRYARDFAGTRRTTGAATEMSRLYAIESSPSPAGSVADHRFRAKPSQMEPITAAFYHALGSGVEGNHHDPLSGKELDAIVKDLQAHRGACLVVAGDDQSPAVHAMVHHMNEMLGNVGKTVTYTEPVSAASKTSVESIKALTDKLNSGAVEALFIVGGNPVYDAPSDVKFAEALAKAKNKIHFTQAANETSAACDWKLPLAHAFEEWTDGKTYDGTITLGQPLTAPLFEAKSFHEILASLSDKPQTGMELVKETHAAKLGSDNAWRQALHDGFIAGSASPATAVTAKPYTGQISSVGNGFEVQIAADPSIYDGRYANNSWLQELPKPMTKTLWDNVAVMSPTTASQLGVTHDESVAISTKGGLINMPVWILPGQAEETITVHLGFGRTKVGSVGAEELRDGTIQSVGVNVYPIRTSTAMNFVTGASVAKATLKPYKVGSTQVHHAMEGRDIIRSLSIDEFAKGETGAPEGEGGEGAGDLYPDPVFSYNGPQWGMAIDLTTCTGCNACVIACQAENNIPSVGKEQVIRGREMHWIRIDRYFTSTSAPDTNNQNYPDNRGVPADPEILFQPVACVHCEKAPCEPVCPVAATVHSHEGLNQMVYNRCVGTRYCSNNCPYKVRRFNFLNYTDNQPQFSTQVAPWPRQNKNSGREMLKMINNPDVTVRGRGVMEKCTYCVQRINDARIEAKKQGRDPIDGEIVTACEQACPSQAITFGNINETTSRLSRLRQDKRSYQLLAELNTKPRTSHLIRLRNPNPELA